MEKVASTRVQSRFESWRKLILAIMSLKHNAAVTSLLRTATSAIAVLASFSRTTHTQRRRPGQTDLSLGTRETRQHVAVRSLAEEFPLPGRRIPHQDGHPLPDRVEGEHVQHLQLNLNKRQRRGVRCLLLTSSEDSSATWKKKQILNASEKNLARIFHKIILLS
jgi:hypothetical protein